MSKKPRIRNHKYTTGAKHEIRNQTTNRSTQLAPNKKVDQTQIRNQNPSIIGAINENKNQKPSVINTKVIYHIIYTSKLKKNGSNQESFHPKKQLK